MSRITYVFLCVVFCISSHYPSNSYKTRKHAGVLKVRTDKGGKGGNVSQRLVHSGLFFKGSGWVPGI